MFGSAAQFPRPDPYVVPSDTESDSEDCLRTAAPLPVRPPGAAAAVSEAHPLPH